MLATNEPSEAKSKPRTLKQSDVQCYTENLVCRRVESSDEPCIRPRYIIEENTKFMLNVSSLVTPCCRRRHLDKGDFFLTSFGCCHGTGCRHPRRAQELGRLGSPAHITTAQNGTPDQALLHRVNGCFSTAVIREDT